VAAAIEGLAGRVAERARLSVTADVRLGEDRRAPELETALYRIVQEAVSNAVRHAGARRIAIELAEERGAVHVHVSDDGRGFDPGAPREGFGLTGMRERVALLRGELEIASSSAGTRVSAAIPLIAGP